MKCDEELAFFLFLQTCKGLEIQYNSVVHADTTLKRTHNVFTHLVLPHYLSP